MTSRKIYEYWLNSNCLTEEEKESLRSLTEEEIEKLFKNKKPDFGTGGIREKVGLGTTKLNRFTCSNIFMAYSQYLSDKYPNPSVAIFYDNRESSKEFALLAATILNYKEMNILLAPENKLLSTPFLSYTIRKLNLDGGINITASHNPLEYNGIKIYNHQGRQLVGKEEVEIIKNISIAFDPASPEPHKYSKFQELDISLLDEYLQDIRDSTPQIGKIRNFPILFSSHHGTTGTTMQKLARLMGFVNFREYQQECTVTSQINPGEIINPEDPNSFSPLIEEAKKQNIDLVFSSDPDGDRSAFAERQKDGSWYFFNGNEMGILSSHFKYQNQRLNNPYIATTHVTGTFIRQLFPNIPVHLVPTGFKNISKIIEEEQEKGNDLLIGFEDSIGSLLTPIHREKDAYQQMAIILELISHLKDQKLTVLEYLNSLFEKYGHWKAFSIPYSVERSSLNIIKETEVPGLSKINYNPKLDMVEWYLPMGSWIKFRYSGTEPKLKVYYNIFGRSRKEAAKTCDKFKTIIDNLLEQN